MRSSRASAPLVMGGRWVRLLGDISSTESVYKRNEYTGITQHPKLKARLKTEEVEEAGYQNYNGKTVQREF